MNLTQVLLSQAYKPTSYFSKSIHFASYWLIILGFGILSPYTSFAQQSDPNEGSRNYYFLQKKSVTPPSPGAADLGKYGDIQINNFTGALNLQIPIHTIKGNDISTSVSLNYDGSGNKVETLPSLVGLGWTLNVAGVITRSVQGKPDNYANYFSKGSELYNLPPLSDEMATNDYFYKIAKGELEPQPDIYYFNFNGMSGKFAFKADSTIVMKDAKDLVIEANGVGSDNVISFIVKDVVGNKYYFDITEGTNLSYEVDNNTESDIRLVQSNYNYISAWYLSKIEAANGNETIEFSYTTTHASPLYYEQPKNYSAYSSISYRRQIGSNNLPTINGSTNISSQNKISDRRFINLITYKLGGSVIEKVEFVKSTPNLTYNSQAVKTDALKLDEIKIYAGSNAATAMRKFNIIQNNPVTNRLTLNKIEEESIIEATIPKKTHEFAYEGTALPSLESNGIDHWGYYNGSTGNVGLIPTYNGDYPGDQANRSTNTNSALASLLIQVKYPTGGYSVFDLETHTVEGATFGSADRIVGGARVKEVKNYTSAGVMAYKKQYAYVVENSTASSGILLGEEPSYIALGYYNNYVADYQYHGHQVNTNYETVTLSATSRSNLGSVQGSHVGYKRVEEITEGKVVYSYRAVKLLSTEWDDNDNGNLLKKQVYHTNGKLLTEMENTYNSDSRRALVFTSFSIDSKPTQDNLILLCKISNSPQFEWRLPIAQYQNSPACITAATYKSKFQMGAGVSFRQSWKLMTQSVGRQYFYDTNWNLTGTVVTTNNSTYANAKISQPTESTVTNSDNATVFKTKTFFTEDGVGNSQTTGAVLTAMITKNMIGLPIRTEKWIGTNLANAIEVHYDVFNSNQYFPKYLKLRDRGTTTWTTKYTIDTYNANGLPTQITMGGFGKSEVYTWDRHLLLTKVYGNTFPNILTWAFTYDNKDRPLSKADENGLLSKFTFDGLNRLVKMQNRFDGTISSPTNVQETIDYAYNYGTGATLQNYVSTKATYFNIPNNPNTNAAFSTKQYFDGLGRPVAGVKEYYTPSVLHQKNFVGYDIYGRQNKGYLPIEDSNTGVNTDPSAFLSGKPFVETIYESSPLSRVASQKNVDNTEVKTSYGTNSANDIRIFTSTGGGGGGPLSSSYFPENTLTKICMTDENGKLTYVFKDKVGRVVLTRKILNSQNVDTYNVYNEYSDLAAVVPPGAIVNGAVVATLIFQYKYDTKGRLSEKKVPSADWQRFYYDNRDLLTLTQDGNMYAANTAHDKHIGTEYDDLGRVKKTGWITTTSPTTIALGVTIPEDTNKLTGIKYYDNSSWVKHQGAKVLKPSGVSTLREFVWSYIERRPGLTYTGNPVWTGKQHLLSKTWLDGTTEMGDDPITDNDYGGVNWTISAYDGSQKPTRNVNYIYSGPSSTHAQEVRQLSDFVYDNGQRLKQTKYDYALFGAGLVVPTYVLSDMTYNYKDQVTEKNTALVAGKYLQSTDFAYNLRGWLTSINSGFQQTDNDYPLFSCSGWEDYYAYGSGTYPSNMPFTPAAQSGEDNADLFKEIIRYDDPNYLIPGAAVSQRNGNISQIEWQVAGKEAQGYSFHYDDLDRLTEANYVDIHSSNYSSHGWTQQYKTDNKYQEKVSYDLRGNITTLERNGLTSNCMTYNGFVGGLWGKIDNLTYNYDPADLNKLIKVTDAADLIRGFKSVNNNSTYTYDANGNLTSDLNKNITGITYNYLNLPLVISFTGNNRIEFIYDATGAKLRKTTYVNNVLQAQDTRDYVNGVEYKGGAVDRFAHTEGAVVRQADGTTFLHEYTIKDHLGNARVTYSDANNDGIITVADIKQINHYYPFGMNMEGNWNGAAGSNKYQYNGKEWNDDFGLGWNDYGARFYDAAVGRFPVVDPLSEKFLSQNPYNYVMNRPTIMIDPNGMEATFNAQTGEIVSATGKEAQNYIRGLQNAAKKSAKISFNMDVNVKPFNERRDKGKTGPFISNPSAPTHNATQTQATLSFEADDKGNIDLAGKTKPNGFLPTVGSDYTDGKGTLSTYSFFSRKGKSYLALETRISPSETSAALNLDIGIKPFFSLESTLGQVTVGSGEAIGMALFEIKVLKGNITAQLLGSDVVVSPDFNMRDPNYSIDYRKIYPTQLEVKAGISPPKKQ